MNVEWLKNATSTLNYNALIKFWTQKGNMFRKSTTRTYKTSSLNNIYQIIISLIFRIYGHKDAKIFMDSWVSSIFYIASQGKTFNLGTILLSNLNQTIKKLQDSKYDSSYEFYMSLYLLDAICVGQHFPGMNLRLLLGEPIIHVCYKLL